MFLKQISKKKIDDRLKNLIKQTVQLKKNADCKTFNKIYEKTIISRKCLILEVKKEVFAKTADFSYFAKETYNCKKTRSIVLYKNAHIFVKKTH